MSNRGNAGSELLTIEATTCKTGGEHTIGRGIISHNGHSHQGGPQKCLMCDKTLEQLFKESNQTLLARLEAEGPKSIIGTKRGMFDTGVEIDIYKDGYNAAAADYTQAINKLRKEL